MPTGNERTDAKNSLGLSALAPVDPAFAEVLPRSASSSQRAMDILTDGGSIVRSTHPGVVGKVVKAQGSFVVEIVATKGVLNQKILLQSSFTRYSNLGTVEVIPGEKVEAGQQLGTVRFQRVNGQQGMSYQVFKNGTGSAASEASPESEDGIAIVKAANPDGIAPSTEVQLRQSPPEAGSNAPQLAPTDEPSALADLPTTGPRTSNLPFESRPVVRFVEQKNQVFTHDFLVFINGVDVTKFVVGNLEVNLVDKDGWNEASVILNNATDNFTITYANLGIGTPDGKPKFRIGNNPGEDKYSERAKKEIMDYKTDETRNPFVDIETMKIIEAGSSQGIIKFDGTGFSEGSVGAETSNIAKTSLQEIGQRSVGGQQTAPQTDRRWQIGFQSTVFHKNDPIRIFRKNPIREADEWMPAFTGYLENISYDTNYVTGVSNVKLTCYDIRAIISKMRVQTTAVTAITNPRAIFRARPESGIDSLFTDLLDPSIQFHPLSGRRYEDVMEFLITGMAVQDEELTKQFRDSGFSRGVGDFTVGDRIYHKPGDIKTGAQPDGLEHWHSLCLFGMDGKTVIQGDKVKTGKAKDVLGAPFNRRWLTEAEARKIGSETTHDGEWAPHSMFLHFLLPAEGTGARNLLDFDAFNANGNQLEFRGKLDILQDFSNRIDYQFWVTPMGDIVVEFPQYDFFPRDYGEYKTVFQVNKHLQSDNVQDEAGEMTTAVIAHGRISPASEANIQGQFQPKAVVVAPLMMIRYGVLEHELTLPFISHAPSLKRLAQIAFQKKLAESNRMDMQFDYRPFITPNRPIENIERHRMALTTTVQNKLDLFKSAITSISSRYVRRALFREDGSIGYTLITGGTSMPITYRQIYKIGTQGPLSQGGRSTDTGVELAISSATTREAGANPSSKNGTGLDSTEPLLTPSNQSVITAINNCVENEFGFSSEMTGRFKAIGQQMSGFTETVRNTATGGFGIFQMRSDVRGDGIEQGAFGIGDTISASKQISAAGEYFRDLTAKYKGNLDDVVAEFSLGAEKIKNIDIRKEFDEGWGKVNKELGKAWEELSQTLTDGFNKLFPGETDPVNTETAAASDEAKKAIAEAEAEGVEPADAGFQSSVGVLVYDNSLELLRSNEESLLETQERQAASERERA